MKCIVFIIVFLNTFSNTFAWVLIMIAQILAFWTLNLRNPEYLIATIWEGRKWSQTVCDEVYEGAIDYTRVDNFEPFLFPDPGERVTLLMDVYVHCEFDSSYKGRTFCHQGCTINHTTNYNYP
ncbi:hypothetical protein GLOIN_2v1479435 [Rhizophagus irregularis DAOM 181602=DAOM 197198]|nr:hypothetical protein GLOIN_2v1479435 [Rhizophagus irregularis DAOM 181602=DAOM 197198]